ncbi:hypothetical protein CRUP_024707 [Coryphaenoides rupestris]|nr:hypothetical protein CRUP_024707 [Coryphaenoides rupestris]
MKLGRSWMWFLLLSSLAVTALEAQNEEPEADFPVSEVPGLDEDEIMAMLEEEEAMVEEEEEEDSVLTDSVAGGNAEEKDGTDANVSFQVTYKTPIPTGEVYFAETFDDGSLDRWQVSKTMKEDADEDIAKYDGKWAVEQLKENIVPGDQGLVLKSRAKHHAIAALLDKPFAFQEEPLVLQYEVNFQDGIDCGGAYIKLLSDTPGLNLDLEEKHAKRADVDLKKIYMDKKTHLYTLVLNPDNSYEMLIDQSSVSRGSLLHDVVPPVNPAKEIDDPKDSKPADWDERAKIPDPEAVKPEDWDEEAPVKIEDPDALKPEGWLDEEPEFVSDPSAEKPEDWDEEMDGEWEAPQIPNPVCETAPGCGTWKSPTINNPKYKGKWKAPLVDNPNYQDEAPSGPWAWELWSMTPDIYFDNFIVTSHKEPGVFAQLMLAAEERPWLWVIYILTVGLPFALAVLFCWPKKPEDEYVYKKTEVPRADVEEEEEEEEEDGEEEEDEGTAAAEEEQAAEASANESAPPADVTEEVEEVEEEEEEEDSAAAGGDSQEGEDDEEEEEEEEEEAEAEGKAPEGTSEETKGGDADTYKQAVRKRRVRKD